MDDSKNNLRIEITNCFNCGKRVELSKASLKQETCVKKLLK